MLSAKVDVDDGLLEETMNRTGIRQIGELVDFALRQLLRRERQLDLLSLKGKVDWEGNLEVMRGMRGVNDPC